MTEKGKFRPRPDARCNQVCAPGMQCKGPRAMLDFRIERLFSRLAAQGDDAWQHAGGGVAEERSIDAEIAAAQSDARHLQGEGSSGKESGKAKALFAAQQACAEIAYSLSDEDYSDGEPSRRRQVLEGQN